MRPIRPEDEPALHQFLRRVTSTDLRLRFFSAMKEFNHEFIARLTQLDYARAMAFVAFDEATMSWSAWSGFTPNSIYESGEYAILLSSDFKGRGLGWALMQLIIEYAKSEGPQGHLGRRAAGKHGDAGDVPEARFRGKFDPQEHDICNVTLRL